MKNSTKLFLTTLLAAGTLFAGMQVAKAEDITLTGDETYTNDGELKCENIVFTSDEDGTAIFYNNGSLEVDDIRLNFWCNNQGSNVYAVFENNGTLISDSVRLYVQYLWLTNYGNDHLTFINRGEVIPETGTLNISTFTKIELVSGSQIVGNLSFGKPAGGPHANWETLVITLNANTTKPLILGDFKIENCTPGVEVNIEAINGVYLNRYSQVVWSGESSMRSRSGTTTADNGVTYAWSLDSSTGLLTAKSENIDELYIVSDSSTGYSLNSKDLLDFSSSLGYYYGNISGNGQIDSTTDINFSGDLTDFTGTLSVSAGTFTATSVSSLGSCDIILNSEMIIEGGRVLKNNFSGSGILSFSYGDFTISYSRFNKFTGSLSLYANLILTNGGRLSHEISGNGTLTLENGYFEISSDNLSNFSGTLNILDTLLVSNGATLGSSNIEIEGEIILDGDFEFTNKISGDGKITLQNGTFSISRDVTDLNDFTGIISNSGTVYKDISLHGNEIFVNEEVGTVVDSWVEFESQQAGTAKFQNYGKASLADVFFVLPSTLGIYNSDFSAVFENYGNLTTEASCIVGFDTGWNESCELTSSDFENKFSFINRGIINTTVEQDEAASLTLGSFVDVTLVGGSQIVGNVLLGDALEVQKGAETKTFRSDVETLNIVLSNLSTGALIEGDLILDNFVQLNVCAEGDAQSKYYQQIWSGDLITGDYLNEISVPATEAFETNMGVFDLDGMSYIWRFDVLTGMIVASSEDVETELIARNATDEFLLNKKDTLNFAEDLKCYAGTVSGNGEIYSTHDMDFSADLSDFGGKFVVAMGMLTTTSESVLGSCSVIISSEMVIDGGRTLENKFSGAGRLTLENGIFELTEEFDAKILHIVEDATLAGATKLSSNVEKVLFDGTLALDVLKNQKFSFGTASVEFSSTAKLDLSFVETSLQKVPFINNSIFDALEAGQKLVILEGTGNVSYSNIDHFLLADDSLRSFVENGVIIYDLNDGLSVRGVNENSIKEIQASGEFSADFVFKLFDVDIVELLGGNGFLSEEAFEEIYSNNQVLSVLLDGNTSAAEKIIRQASPLGYAAMLAVPATSFYSDSRAISARLESRRTENLLANETLEFFAQATGTSVENDTGTDSPMFDFDTFGVLAGVDYRLNATTALGFAVGYETGDADIHDSGGKIDVDNLRVMLFAGTTFGRVFLEGGVEVAFSDFDAKRRSAFGESAGDTSGLTAGAFVNLGTRFDLLADGSLTAIPRIGVAFAHMTADSFSESGGRALEIDSFSGDSLRASVGLEFAWKTALAGTPIRVGLDFSYARDFLGDEADIDFSLDGNGYTATAKLLDENIFTVSPSIGIGLTKSSEIYASYAFDLGTNATAHRGNVGFRVKF